MLLRLACVTGAVMALAASSAMASGSFVLTATTPTTASGYAPTFTGNGLLGVRVPATGQGYAGGTVPAQSELAGFYAKPTKPMKRRRRRAAARQHPDLVDAHLRRRRAAVLAEAPAPRPAGASRWTCTPA